MKDAIVFFTVVIVGLLIWFTTQRRQRPRFRQKAMLTGTSLEFFHLLRRALPEATVCPQVAMSALIEPAGLNMLRQGVRKSIDGARAGYAVFDEDMELLVVIELAYRSRRSRKEVHQEECLASAGIRCLRFQAKRLPSEATVRGLVFPRNAESRRRAQGISADPADSIEFRPPKTPWRNTEQAHI